MAIKPRGTRRKHGAPRASRPVDEASGGEVIQVAGSAQTRDSIADVWGERTPYVGDWPPRVDEYLEAEPDRWVRSCCALCSNGCGLDVGVKESAIVGVRGLETDRVNRGRL